jgi:hypothetical protein
LHYVNIALGNLFLAGVFVTGSVGAALDGFVFTAKDPTIQKQKSACAAGASATKTVTKINAEGTASGESKRGTVAGTVEFCEQGDIFIKIKYLAINNLLCHRNFKSLSH